MVKFKDIKIGDVVQVRTCFGTGFPIRARVVGVDINIKNSQPGIDYVPFAGGTGSWAYLHQVDHLEAA